MLEWIRQELVEARFLRTVYGANNRTATDLARMMYTCLLSVEILRHVNPTVASRYASQTLMGGGFKQLNPGVTDLYNLIVLLGNQEDYKDLIKTDFDISPGLLEVKNYLTRVAYGTNSNYQDRFILINLSKLLNVDSTVDLMSARRTISFWEDMPVYEKKSAMRLILANIRRLAPTLDIMGYLTAIVD
jgi:hypothetical protein